MKYILYFLLLTFTICTLSCEKYLDRKSSNAFAVPVSLGDLQALLDDALNMNEKRTPSMGEGASDDYFLLQATFDARNELEQNVYRWVSFDTYTSPNDWSANYFPIYNANYCLEMIEKIPVTSSNRVQWENVKGSALFYRSYYFLQLAWTFAKAYDSNSSNTDFGIPLRLTSDFNIPTVRASVTDSYDRLINDTKEAIQYLPNSPQHPFRPSKAAAYGLLARAYLSMRNYDSALEFANKCLSINSELIDYKGDADFNGSSASFPFKRFNKETVFYTEMSQSVSIALPARAKIDTSLYATYESSDIRKGAYFIPNSGYHRFKGSYSGDNNLFTGIATNEMYLIRAECYARKGDVLSSLKDLNSLLVKRHQNTFIPITVNNPNDALTKILLERRKELLMRGLRWSDIKRLNKEGANISLKRIISGQTYNLQPNDNRYAIPIPNDIIRLTGIPQNPY